jgi:hypothetical protein
MSFFLSLRRLAAVLAAAAALPACQQTCPLGMAPPPTFMLAFSADTLTSSGVGFRRAELRSAYLVRYNDAEFQSLIDTLRQPSASTANSTKPVFPIYYPPGHLPQFGLPDFVSQNASSRSFRLVVPAANRTYNISNIVLTQEPGESRCDGYHLTRREANVNGQLRDGLATQPILTK